MATATTKTNPNPTGRAPRLPEALTSATLGELTEDAVGEATDALERQYLDAAQGGTPPRAAARTITTLRTLAAQLGRYHRTTARGDDDGEDQP